MIEGEPKIKNNTENKPHSSEEVFVKDAWFKAYFRGNATIPQTFHGITLSLAIGLILEDKNVDWDKFFNSKFSDQQLDTLGNAMSVMHSRRDIAIVTENNADLISGNDRARVVIDPDRLQNLWDNAKSILRDQLMMYFDGKIKNSASDGVSGDDIDKIKSYFENASNNIKLENLKKALKVILESFNDAYIRNLLSKYRDSFKEQRGDMDDLSPSNTEFYTKKFSEYIIEKLKTIFPDGIPKEVISFVEFR